MFANGPPPLCVRSEDNISPMALLTKKGIQSTLNLLDGFNFITLLFDKRSIFVPLGELYPDGYGIGDQRHEKHDNAGPQ
jgi:hypothetical protein